MHWLRLEWQQLCFGYAVSLGYYAQYRAVLAAALRHTPMTAAAARIAAAMLGLARTCSAVVHALGQCLQWCLGILLWHWPRLNGSSEVWAGANALSVGAHSRQCLRPFVGPLLWHWLRLELQPLCLGYAVSLGYYARSMAVLAAVIRHNAMASAAARTAAAMIGLA